MAIRLIFCLSLAVTLAACGGGAAHSQVPDAPVAEAASFERDEQLLEVPVVEKDVPYVPTPQETVEEMLRMAKVSREDLVYDLGSGDGRIVITAAKKYGARGVGIDIDPQRIREANENARAAGVTDRVKFVQGDLFKADFRDATAVTLYLLRSVNIRLRPKLLEELRPGTPVVSHDFDMGEWEPDDQTQVAGDQLYLWIIPAKVEGTWSWITPDGQRRSATVRQQFQKLDGRVETADGNLVLQNAKVRGEEVSFDLTRGGNASVVESYRGRITGKTIIGTAEAGGRRWNWRAQHE